MDKIEIGRSRFKTFLLILGAVGFVVAGILMIRTSEIDMFEKFIGGIGILFFGAAIPLGIKKLITNEVALEISRNNLILEPNSNKKYVLVWNEILGFDVVKIKGAKIIIIEMNNPQKWINKESNLVKKKMMQYNYNNYGTPFNITAAGLSVSHSKLLSSLRDYHSENKF